jgi:hypothetical protein
MLIRINNKLNRQEHTLTQARNPATFHDQMRNSSIFWRFELDDELASFSLVKKGWILFLLDMIDRKKTNRND